MTPERVVWAVIVFLAVAAFTFAGAGQVEVAETIAVALFLVFNMTVLICVRANVGREDER